MLASWPKPIAVQPNVLICNVPCDLMWAVRHRSTNLSVLVSMLPKPTTRKRSCHVQNMQLKVRLWEAVTKVRCSPELVCV